MRDATEHTADAPPRTTGPSRRGLIGGSAALATGLLGVTSASATALPGPVNRTAPAAPQAPAPLTFTAVPASEADEVVVPTGFAAQVLAPWGLPLDSDGPHRPRNASGTAAEQTRQVGSHHHGVHFFPLAPDTTGRSRGRLVINHETYDPVLLEGTVAEARAAQGVTVLEVRESGDGWQTVDAEANRRITADTPVRFSGPVTADGDPRGVLACGALGVTPWGTCLVAEENFNAVFGTDDPGWRRRESDIRYGLSAAGFGHPWHRGDRGFDLATADARPEAYGWIVELDPHDPSSVPVKRTALGRFMHGSATVTESGGHLVVHSTDAEDGGYLYKYVSDTDWRTPRAQGRSPLDHGTLYVARMSGRTGTWLPLRHGEGPLTRSNGWRDQADVLLRARLAADALRATPLGRPERVAVDPADGQVYLALANSRGDASCTSLALPGTRSSAASVRAADPHGRIVRWHEDPTASRTGGAHTFRWETFLTAEDSASAAAGAFAAPKGLWFGPDGTLWISTGVSGHELNGASALHRAVGNNALLAADTTTGAVRRFLTAPRGAEVTGVGATPDGRTLFVNIQHPGERTARWGAPSAQAPGAVSTWPDRRTDGRPRSATVAVSRTS